MVGGGFGGLLIGFIFCWKFFKFMVIIELFEVICFCCRNLNFIILVLSCNFFLCIFNLEGVKLSILFDFRISYFFIDMCECLCYV